MHKQKRLTAFVLSAVIILFIAFNADYAEGIGVSGIPLPGSSITNSVDVIPGGNTVGIKLYTKGLLTVDTASFETLGGTLAAPAKESGIFSGDIILEIDGREITSNEMFIEEINKRGETPLTLGIMRKNNRTDITVTPRQATDKKYKIGVWVRDSAAGIGTMTFCRTDNGAFAALGHGISDGDIGQQYVIREGSIEKAEISAIVKGEKGIPGELKGVFTGRDEIMGRVSENGVCGLYGKMNQPVAGNPVKVASKWEVREGEAKLLCTTDGSVEEYTVEIQRIMPGSGNSSKAMIIKITDERLLAKTGGIVQGMSGSPILQNGKLAGAVTHVFVNDPTRGYAIFAETMLAETDKIR